MLDSFAVLAFLEGEAGQPIVQELLTGAEAGTHVVYLSLINLGEALLIIEREQGLMPAERAWPRSTNCPFDLSWCPAPRSWPLRTSRHISPSRTLMDSPLRQLVNTLLLWLLVTGRLSQWPERGW